MREFTAFEKQIIQKLISAKEIRDLPLIKLIDENTDAIAFEWDLNKPEFKIFNKHPNPSDEESFKLFNQVQEIVFLIKFLEDNNLIYLHRNEEISKNWLFNKNRYKRDTSSSFIN